jgi:hypothetical protein
LEIGAAQLHHYSRDSVVYLGNCDNAEQLNKVAASTNSGEHVYLWFPSVFGPPGGHFTRLQTQSISDASIECQDHM